MRISFGCFFNSLFCILITMSTGKWNLKRNTHLQQKDTHFTFDFFPPLFFFFPQMQQLGLERERWRYVLAGSSAAFENTLCSRVSEFISYSHPLLQEESWFSWGRKKYLRKEVTSEYERGDITGTSECLCTWWDVPHAETFTYKKCEMWHLIIFSYWVTTENILARVLNLKCSILISLNYGLSFCKLKTTNQFSFIFFFFCFSYPRRCLL